MMSRFILCFCVALLQLVSGEVVETGFKYGQSELILNCSLPDDKVSWYHNGTLVVEADNLKLIRENSVHMLKITKPKMAHIGSYTCEGSGKAVADFRVSMEPVVAALPTSFNIVEGENFRLPCVVYGYPTPNIEWRREGEEGQWESLIADGHFMFEPNNEGIANGTLLIEEVKLEDRDNYMCFASNDLGNHNGTTLIRVIDKYAALWPFLGICIEVIVLCAVIFVCEKRRNKKQFDESDNEQNNTKHTGNAKDSEVRNRK